MDPNTFWLIVLAIATPISGVVGFAIQLRRVRTSHLENEKLELEIQTLREQLEASERRIVEVTTDEVVKYTGRDLMFSRSSGRGTSPRSYTGLSMRDIATDAALVLAFFLILGYLIYDIYRLATWVISRF